MYETETELDELQTLLDTSLARSTAHLRSIVVAERTLTARQLVDVVTGMCTLAISTVTAEGERLAASLADSDSGDPEPARRDRGSLPERHRHRVPPRAQLQTFFAGFDPVEPGLVEIPDWCPTSAEQARAERARTPWVGLAVGRKP